MQRSHQGVFKIYRTAEVQIGFSLQEVVHKYNVEIGDFYATILNFKVDFPVTFENNEN